MIKHEDGKWVLHFSDGRKEKFDSEEAAIKREKQVNFFKALEKHPEIKKHLRKKNLKD